jgi:hypothetical protein
VTVLTISDLNALVLDYLLVEGFSDAAISFAKETGLSVDIDSQAIQQRMIIKEAVEDGRVEDAVRRVNELDPEVCLPSFSLPTTMFAPMIQTSCTTLSRLAPAMLIQLIHRPVMRGKHHFHLFVNLIKYQC